jgi:16S rRNA C1402 (ribose-2'-O) methylase RsmI
VEITLTLEAQQFISVHDVFLVEHIRIAQFLLMMKDINKVWRALSNHSNITEQLLNRSIDSGANLHNLIKLTLDSVEAHIDLNAAF